MRQTNVRTVLEVQRHYDHAIDNYDRVRFHFFLNPVVALQGMLQSLKPLGRCLVTFETDNGFRRLILFLRIGISGQYYYKRAEALDLMREAGFNILKSGSVTRLPSYVLWEMPEHPTFCPETFGQVLDLVYA